MTKQSLSDSRDFHIPGSVDNSITKEEREHMQTLIFRRWPPFLSGAEQKIILFVYDRTIHYNRRWAYSSIETLLHGYPFKDDRNFVQTLWAGDAKVMRSLTARERAKIDEGDFFLTAPTGLSRRQIVTALGALIDRRFILRAGTKQVPELALNPDAYYDYSQIFFPRKRRR